MLRSGTEASAENSRIINSSLPISREKIDGRLTVFDRGRPREVQRQGRLAGPGPAGDGDHLSGVQTVGDLVQAAEARSESRSQFRPWPRCVSISSRVACSSDSMWT